ncbi:DUF4097 family beta strand repeat-containing protein [Catenulispora subtropica]|uniref:DUF4097 domain-containing protein n=1 Tax=Catenulispora subtropica TaxID=450798 RepID=A0ABN2S7E3_9ACTN
MTQDVSPTRRPIGAVRISSAALVGVVAAVLVPTAAAATAVAISGRVTGEHTTVAITPTGPITRVVVEDSDSDVFITGDAAATDARGQAEVQWKGVHGPRPVLHQSVADGVLTLSKDCSPGACGSIDITLRVPPGISVRAATSSGRIQVRNVAGGVDLTSLDGDLEAFGLGSGPASFTTTDGTVRAAFTGAPDRIAVSSGDGDVTITTDGRTPYYDNVTTTDGGQELGNVGDRYASREIDVTTTNGKVTIQ